MDGHSGSGAQGLIRYTLDEEAYEHRHKQREGDGNIQRHPRYSVYHYEAGAHENVAVCKVDQAQYAVNHGIAYSYKGVLSAYGYACQQIRQVSIDKIHLRYLRGWWSFAE